MAGIGFELKKLLKPGHFRSVISTYTYAGIISSGPWILSILGVMLIGFISYKLNLAQEQIREFLVSVTYLMAASLILSGSMQLLLTRFVADRLFEKRERTIFPNLMSILALMTMAATVIGSAILWATFEGTPITYQILMLANFVLLCNMWLIVIFMSSIKAYKAILAAFFVGYSCTILLALLLHQYGLEGLLSGLFIGHAILTYSLLFIIVKHYPGDEFSATDFLDKKQVFVSLVFCGLFYNFGVWIDKFLFWFYEPTSEAIIGPLRSSVIYDLPIFLAYLAIVPGMAAFLVRIETDFSEQYDKYFQFVRDGGSLEELYLTKNAMIETINRGIYEIIKIQGITVLVLFIWGKDLLEWIGISPFYINLFYIDLVGVSCQVILLALLNVLFYLDERIKAVIVCAIFAFGNWLLTDISLILGPNFYGYGFALSVGIASMAGYMMLSRTFDRLEYETFMLQKSG